MKRKNLNPFHFQLIDLVPALSGLIGKTALVTSFAVVWAAELQITNPDFVFENVRIEMIIGGIITLLAALLLPDTAPSGTLAPLIVLIPAMAAFGVHPFLLSICVGIIGIFGIVTKLFHKLIALSGQVSKVSLTLTFGIAGVLLSLKNLINFFEGSFLPLILILGSLTAIYLILRKWNKAWLIVPVAAVVSVLISTASGFHPGNLSSIALPSLNPDFWWNKMWGIGFGFNFINVLKTLPFAFFVLILWAIDTVSITAMLDANYQPHEKKEEINLNRSFIVTSIRNMLGGMIGGAQTSALWRSFLIPLFMVKRPLRPASILLGLFSILAGLTAVPIWVMSFPPLIWSVLLFGIFLPFIVVGMKNFVVTDKLVSKLFILLSVAAGILINPFISWIIAILYENIDKKLQKTKDHQMKQ